MKRLILYLFVVFSLGVSFYVNADDYPSNVSVDNQYDYATQFLKDGDYPGAEQAFRKFLEINPNHKLAGNAQYWLAETFRIRELYTDAAQAYLDGYKKYSKGQKAPINLVKLGMMMVQIGEKKLGCKMIVGMALQYPKASNKVKQKANYESQKYKCDKQDKNYLAEIPKLSKKFDIEAVKAEPSQTLNVAKKNEINIYAKTLIAPNSTLYFMTLDGRYGGPTYLKFDMQFIKDGKLINDYKFDRSEKLFFHKQWNTNSIDTRISKKLYLKILNTDQKDKKKVFLENKTNIFQELLNEYVADTKSLKLIPKIVSYFNDHENYDVQTQIAKVEQSQTQKKKVVKAKEPKQEEFKPENKDVDNQAPIIEVAKNLKFESQTFKFKGRIKDKNKFYLTANGRPVKTDRKGRFEIEGFVIDPEQGEQLKLVAIDQWNNRSEQTVNIEVEFKQVVDARSYEKPNPNKVRVRNNDNKVGIIIGIEKYQTLNNVDAPYANRDANAFRAYANRALGIPNQNLKVLIDNKATRAELLKSLKIWLPQVTRGQQKDVYIFFAGHGLASDDGKDLHILPQDGDPILLEDTAISRVEMFELINKVNPNSVTMFFDTCYSGQTRSEQMLVAGLRPVRIVANDQEIPNNYTIFTASDNDETSGSIEQAEHGIFSYYLMKGLEGNADINKDKTLTNGELIAYLKNNVSQEAFSQNRQQEPMLSGNPDNILIRY